MGDLGLWYDPHDEQYHREHPINREEDNWYLHVIDLLAQGGRLTRKRKGAMYTTKVCR